MSHKEIARSNRRRLILYFDSGVKAKDDGARLGVEVEHLVVTEDGDPVSYEPRDGGVGIREVLAYLEPWYPCKSVNSRGELLGLLGEEGSVTLEPAAQLEFSAAPYERVSEIRRAYEHFTSHVAECLEPYGAHLVNRGYHPTRRAQQLVLIPKQRYAFMDAYFSYIGSHGDRMMRASASTQVSVDYFSEEDAVRKMRVASALSPVLAAIADNAPVYEGEANHVPIRRLQLWREVDCRRCGTVPGVFDGGFGFERYVDWLLSTSPIFVTQSEAGNTCGPSTRPFFDEAASEAYADAPMDESDVEHLISMFWPDVRLKRFVEIRPADSLPLLLMLGYVALIKGIFYCERSLAAIERTLGVSETAFVSRGAWPLNACDVDEAISQIQRRGLAGEVYGMSLDAWERLLFSLARDALPEDEADLLVPLEEFAVQKPWWYVRNCGK